ncbi:MAG: hypothetical protein ABJC26_04515 [Gemmatimonadaceae bacterium]
MLLVVGCWLLVVGCWLLVVGCWLLVLGCWWKLLLPTAVLAVLIDQWSALPYGLFYLRMA